MHIKIDVQANISDHELTLETCSQIINLLQDSYHNIRKELYNYFLGKRNLKRTLLVVAFFFALFLASQSIVFVYLMPLSVILSLIASILSAEYMTSQSRKQIQEQLKRYKQKREILLKQQSKA